MEVGVLGPLVVVGGGTPAASKERAVLELLALRAGGRAGGVVSEAVLVDAVWGGQPPATASKTLHTLISRLRRTTGLSIERLGVGYRLDIDPDAVDVHRFERLVISGRAALVSGAHDDALADLSTAVGLWRGAPLGDVAGGVAEAEVVRLEQLLLDVEEDLVAAHLARCEETVAVGHVEQLVRLQPLRERRWAQLMLALYRSGRRAEALRAFQRARRVLGDSTGLEPGPELVALERAILDDDPALRMRPTAPASAAQPSALPMWATSLVGRDEQRARLLGRLEHARLVTLTGIGGVGKTRLAAAAAEDRRARRLGDVHFVDLSSVHDSDAVEDAVATALDVPRHPDRSLTEQIVVGVSSDQSLLVLDNCEHVVDGVARLVRDLIGRAPGLRVLATSREPLEVTGEIVERVDPLGIPTADERHVAVIEASPAVRLFLDRARDIDPAIRLTEHTAGHVASICRQVDGIPLAVEVAAAHIDVLGPAQISQRLSDGGLRNPRRDRLPRHESMDTVLDWSYQHLDELDRCLLDRLAVFRGPTTVEAIEVVVADERLPADAVLDALVRLVRRSLVVATSDRAERRYRLLEPVRSFAWQRLAETDELATWRTRHLEWTFALLADAADGWARDVARWHRTIEDNVDNIEQALTWAATTPTGAEQALRSVGGIFSYWGTRRAVGARWCRSLAHAATDLAPARRADALWNACFLVGGIDLTAAASIAGEARQLAARAPGDAATDGLATLAEMTCAVFRGDMPAVRATSGRAAPHLDGLPRLFADYFDMWARSLHDDHDAAHDAMRHLLQRVHALGDEHIYSGFLGEVVDLGLMTDTDRDQLRDEALHALDIARRVPCPLCESKALTSLLLVDSATQSDAVGQARHAVLRAHESGLPFAVIIAMPGLEAALHATGATDDAVQLTASTETLRRRTGHCHLLPARRHTHHELIRTARQLLGVRRFTQAWTRGAALTYPQLITLATEPLAPGA